MGTNDLNSETSAQLHSKSIVDLAKSVTSVKRKNTVSGIIPGNDEWNNKETDQPILVELTDLLNCYNLK